MNKLEDTCVGSNLLKLGRESEKRMEIMQIKSRGADEVIREALRCAMERFDDIAAIVEKDGKYDNASFLRASADRIRLAFEIHHDLLHGK